MLSHHHQQPSVLFLLPPGPFPSLPLSFAELSHSLIVINNHQCSSSCHQDPFLLFSSAKLSSRHHRQPSALFHSLLSSCASSSLSTTISTLFAELPHFLIVINNHQCCSSHHASQFGCPQFGFINTCCMLHHGFLTLPASIHLGQS
jgi:hypothetical protein